MLSSMTFYFQVTAGILFEQLHIRKDYDEELATNIQNKYNTNYLRKYKILSAIFFLFCKHLDVYIYSSKYITFLFL